MKGVFMSEENLQFPIPNSVLEPYIKQAVSTAIVGALGDGGKLIEIAVQNALITKVSKTGTFSKYDSDNKYLLPEVVATQKIQEIAKQTISEMAEQMKPKIREEVVKQIKTKHKEIAKALVDGLVSSLHMSWMIKVGINSGDE
jgi:hypothetical protein